MSLQESAQEFLLNVETKLIMQKLDNRVGTVNIFEILKTERTEIRHSNVIAWLLDPLESHKLSTKFIEVFFMNVANTLKSIDTFHFSKLILHGLEDVTVYREKSNIDILIISNQTKQVIAIENKTGSQIHGTSGYVNQLDKYKDYIDMNYPESTYERLFLYLDSNLSFADDIGKWRYINYSIIENSLSFCLDDDDVNSKTKLILGDYLENVRRNLMGKIDPETQNLCDEIYKKYKDVIDFIASNKSNTAVKFHNIVEQYLIDNAVDLGIEISHDWCSTFYTRFRIAGLSVESEQEKDIWVKNQLMLFEISGDPSDSYNSPKLRLITCAGRNKDNPKIKRIWENIKMSGKKGEQWRTLYTASINWKGDLDNEISVQSLMQEIQNILKSNQLSKINQLLKESIGS